MNLSITDLTMEELKELIGLIKNDRPVQIKPIIPEIKIEKDLDPIPQRIPLESKFEKTKTEWLTGVDFAKRANIGLSTLYRYKSEGVVETNEDNMYNWETEFPKVCKKQHRTKEAMLNNLKNIKKKTETEIEVPQIIHSVPKFNEWKKDLCKRIELADLKPNTVFHDAFIKMTERYGIVWAQAEKEFKYATGHRPYSTINTAYYIEYESPNYQNTRGVLEAIIDNIIQNKGVYYERGNKERTTEFLRK